MREDVGENHVDAQHRSMPRSPIIETLAAGMKGSHDFLQKLFSRQTNISSPSIVDTKDEIKHVTLADPSKLTYENLKILPCPYIRPLQGRLEPRMENIQKSHRRPPADSTKPTFGKKVEPPCAAPNDPSPETAVLSSKDDLAALHSTETQRRRLREEIALIASADASHLQEWNYYINCYSQGCYSLTTPPQPPPMKPTFTYLTSMYPVNEAERLATFESSIVWSGTDIIWSESEADRARSLIKTANVRFSAPWGAISFFDTGMEIVQAERGYSRHFIPRPESIASHVLLTNEVMTILDTEKDWRFAGNPLVVGQPKVRFFAGAPLLSANGEVIGVFAIFSPLPRTTFTARQRRELTTFSEMAMRDLTSLPEVANEQNIKSPPLVQDTSSPCLASKSDTSFSDENRSTCSTDLTPLALRYHKPSHNRNIKPRATINPSAMNTCSNSVYHSPPNSNCSQRGIPRSTKIIRFAENKDHSLLNSSSTLSNRLPETPESPVFGNLLPNTSYGASKLFSFSDADLGSLDQNYSQTEIGPEIGRTSRFAGTNRSLIDSSSILAITSKPTDESGDGVMASNANFESQNNEIGYSSDTYPFELEFEWPVPPKNDVVQKCAPTEHIHIEKATDTENNKGLNKKARVGSLTASKISNREQIPAEAIAEASFAAEFWAKHLGFDTIYAVELIPNKFFMAEDEVKASGAVDARIMVSYGLQELINFDIPMHLDVLRATGAMTWENSHGSSKEYSVGFMMPLKVNSSMLGSRSIGVVFGAFRKATKDIKQRARISSAEIKRLQQAARVLKNILRKSAPVKQSSQLETAFPSSPTPKGCCINRIKDERRLSFDNSSKDPSMKIKPTQGLTRKK